MSARPPRREFTKAVKVAIVLRATDEHGRVRCEECGLVLGKKPYHIDHTIPDALQVDKSRKLTADDGKLLGVECCHGPKTHKEDVPAIARAKRREARHLGVKPAPARKIQSPGFPKAPKRREIGPKEMQMRALRERMTEGR